MSTIRILLSLVAFIFLTQVQCEQDSIDLGQQEGFYQGDIKLKKEKTQTRNGIQKQFRWPNGIIPYQINITGYTSTETGKTVDYDQDDVKMIEEGMRAIEKSTCIRFVKRTNQNDYLVIKNDGTGCSSGLGLTVGSGRQVLSLTKPGCMTPRHVVHELFHTIGLWHEQSRSDRDEYITINYENLKHPYYRAQFDIPAKGESDTYNVPYNYASIMHYDAWAFNKDNKMTMQPKDLSMLTVMGYGSVANETDFEKIRRIYDCKGKYEPAASVTAAPCLDKWPDCDIQSDQCATDLSTIDNCRKTCGYCEWGGKITPTPRPCKDYRTDCGRFVDKCQTDREIRERVCAYTCGACDKSKTPSPVITTPQYVEPKPKPENGSCTDEFSECEDYIKRLGCHREGENGWMINGCRKSCKFC